MAETKVSSKAFAYVLILRWTIAFIFLIHGYQKLHDPAFGSNAGQFFASLEDDVVIDFYKSIFHNIIVPNANIFAALVKYGELAAGIAFLLGLPLHLAVYAGIFLNANYLMISGLPSLIYLNILMIICQFVVLGMSRD